MKSPFTQNPLCSLKKNSKPLKSIALVTGTRAEWGLLYPLAKALKNTPFFKLSLIVTGAHLSKTLGNTYKEIQADGFKIDVKIPILQDSSSTQLDIAKSLSTTIAAFSQHFSTSPYDMVIILGDRYEAFGVSIACANLNIPIAHISGGETTQGANDEYMRHCITKMSYLHFTSTEIYRRRVIQLGENPSRVFNVGSLAVENIHNTPLLTQAGLESTLQTPADFLHSFCVLTFHSTTLESTNPTQEITLILNALLQSPYKILATKANADSGGTLINEVLESYAKKYPQNIVLCASLGRVLYLSSLNLASFVIGNSSSGLGEAPILRTPTINIGDRQKGRLMPKSVLTITPNPNDEKAYIQAILDSIQAVTSEDFTQKTIAHPFGNGTTSQQMIQILQNTLYNDTINLKKAFYDIEP